jgi:2-polyprenyl-3-methyl-5-hydroxy-6-metoxy-1,4-benzoquinol methylase
VPSGLFGHNLVECRHCGLVWYNSIDAVVPTDIYTKDYFESCYFDYADEKPILSRNFAFRLATIKKLCGTGTLLEIGIAYGFFLELAKAHYTTVGIDVSADAVRSAQRMVPGSAISCGDYLKAEYKKSSFDIVCMFDTIEHLKQPDLFLQKIHSELKTGGLVCLTTGDIGSIAARIQGKQWRLIDPPKHLFYFSAKTLTRLLEQNNFEVVHRSYPGVWRSLAFMCYGLFFRKKSGFTQSGVFKFMQRIPVYVNLFDIMFVIAKKRG